MGDDLGIVEAKKRKLLDELISLGDFRRGSVSVNYRKCGKANCECSREGHVGHGPQYLWNATIKGRSRAKNLRLGPELEKVSTEVNNYQKLRKLMDELVEVSERICELKPVREVGDEKELEGLKKKLQKRFSGKSAGRSSR